MNDLMQESVATQGYDFVLKNYSNIALVKTLTEHYEKLNNA